MVLEKVKKILSEQFDVEEERISADTSIINDLGADSLDTVELLMEFEKEFGVKIPDEETSTIATVADAIAKVAEKLGVAAE